MKQYLLLLTATVCFAQQPPAFDVVSIKPNTTGGGTGMGTSHGRLTATNVSARMLILKGFHAKDFQVTGGPAWLETERYDIVAKTENTTVSDDDLWLLLQPVLRDRFKLRFHRETKQLPVYSLTVSKGGTKLKPHTGDDAPTMRGRTGSGRPVLRARRHRWRDLPTCSVSIRTAWWSTTPD